MSPEIVIYQNACSLSFVSNFLILSFQNCDFASFLTHKKSEKKYTTLDDVTFQIDARIINKYGEKRIVPVRIKTVLGIKIKPLRLKINRYNSIINHWNWLRNSASFSWVKDSGYIKYTDHISTIVAIQNHKIYFLLFFIMFESNYHRNSCECYIWRQDNNIIILGLDNSVKCPSENKKGNYIMIFFQKIKI